MAKYHINPKTGNPGRCAATSGNCPFGDDDHHYSSPEDAAQAYERSKSSFGHVVTEEDNIRFTIGVIKNKRAAVFGGGTLIVSHYPKGTFDITDPNGKILLKSTSRREIADYVVDAVGVASADSRPVATEKYTAEQIEKATNDIRAEIEESQRQDTQPQLAYIDSYDVLTPNEQLYLGDLATSVESADDLTPQDVAQALAQAQEEDERQASLTQSGAASRWQFDSLGEANEHIGAILDSGRDALLVAKTPMGEGMDAKASSNTAPAQDVSYDVYSVSAPDHLADALSTYEPHPNARHFAAGMADLLADGSLQVDEDSVSYQFEVLKRA